MDGPGRMNRGVQVWTGEELGVRFPGADSAKTKGRKANASEVFMNRKEVVPYVLNAVAALIAILPALPLLINANSFRPTIEERGSPRLRRAKCGWGT